MPKSLLFDWMYHINSFYNKSTCQHGNPWVFDQFIFILINQSSIYSIILKMLVGKLVLFKDTLNKVQMAK